MTVNWGDYEIYDPGIRAPLHELSREDARAAYVRLMAAKSARIDMLRRLAKLNGADLDGSDASVQDLNDWFRREAEADSASPDRLDGRWYSVVNDIALYLGDLMIERNPRLRWEFFTRGRKDASFQRHVLVGFEAPNPKYNVDIDRLVATYAHRIVAGVEVEGSAFWKWLQAAVDH